MRENRGIFHSTWIVAVDSTVERGNGLPDAVWRLVQHFVIALRKVKRLQNIKVERIVDFAVGVSRRKLQIDNSRIFRIIRIELAKCLPNDLLVLSNTRPRITAESRRFLRGYLNLLHTRVSGRSHTRRH